MTINIYNRQISYGAEAREKIMQGVNGLADAVAVTLGPKGKSVVIKLGFHDARFTKDGVSVAREVFFPDEMKNMGAEILSNVALRTGTRCGDGTTTATVLARALLASGLPVVAEHIDILEKAIRDASRPVNGYDDHYNVALISANGDAEVAKLIADTLKEVGMDGQITIEITPEVGLRSEIVSGMSFKSGYASPYFVTDAQKMIVELDSPAILVMDKNVYSLEDIFQTLKTVAESGKPLLLIAREVAGDALQTLILNKVKHGVKVAAVSASKLSDDFLEDITIATGASLTENKFGSAKKVILHHDKTVIVEGGGNPEEIEARCNMLRENKIKDRLARLSGGVAVLWVGGHTEAEASERKDRVDDALNATKSAIEEGIVPGGGTALYWAGKSLPDGAVKTASEAPIRQILKNADLDADSILSGIHASDHGYDARKMRHCLMMESGIIDPVKVVCSALRDAASVATLVNNTEAAIVEKAEK